jgi:hypothetical protein
MYTIINKLDMIFAHDECIYCYRYDYLSINNFYEML